MKEDIGQKNGNKKQKTNERQFKNKQKSIYIPKMCENQRGTGALLQLSFGLV